MIVAKVGGSLFDWPSLKPALTAWLTAQSVHVELVAGGGHSADAVRRYDHIHGLGEEIAHQLAILSLAVTTRFLQSLVEGIPNVSVCDVVSFCQSDTTLPHSWRVTTDSIAARIAEVNRATGLVLLKSSDRPSRGTWSELAGTGYVDGHFPLIASRLTCPIHCVNLRTIHRENQ